MHEILLRSVALANECKFEMLPFIAPTDAWPLFPPRLFVQSNHFVLGAALKRRSKPAFPSRLSYLSRIRRGDSGGTVICCATAPFELNTSGAESGWFLCSFVVKNTRCSCLKAKA